MSPLVKEVISKVLELFAQMKLLFPAIMSSSCEETSLCVPISTLLSLFHLSLLFSFSVFLPLGSFSNLRKDFHSSAFWDELLEDDHTENSIFLELVVGENYSGKLGAWYLLVLVIGMFDYC